MTTPITSQAAMGALIQCIALKAQNTETGAKGALQKLASKCYVHVDSDPIQVKLKGCLNRFLETLRQWFTRGTWNTNQQAICNAVTEYYTNLSKKDIRCVAQTVSVKAAKENIAHFATAYAKRIINSYHSDVVTEWKMNNLLYKINPSNA